MFRLFAALVEAAKRAGRGAAPLEVSHEHPAPIVSQNYRDEQAEMAAAEGYFVFAAPEPRPIEEQRAFEQAVVDEAPFAMRALDNGVFESAIPGHTGPAPLTDEERQRMYEAAAPMREALRRVTSGGGDE